MPGSIHEMTGIEAFWLIRDNTRAMIAFCLFSYYCSIDDPRASVIGR